MKPIYIFVLLFMAVPSWARQSCEDLATGTSLWTSKSLPPGFTLSIDSEIPVDQVIAYIRKSPELASNLKRILSPLRIHPGDLAQYVGMSEAQLRKFGLRSTARQDFVTPDDFNAETWRRVMHNPRSSDFALRTVGSPRVDFRAKNRLGVVFETPSTFKFHHGFGFRLFRFIQPLLRKAVAELNLPLVAETDAPDFEFRHKTWSQNPSEFLATVEQLHKLFSNAQTHFHLGIASRLIDQKKLFAVMQALESVMILEAAAKSEYREADRSGYSSLVEDPKENRMILIRGVLGLRLNRWYEPEDMHDIEYRQYLTRDRALKFIEMTIDLTKSQSRLKNFNVNFAGVDPDIDKITFNLHGALLYMGAVFHQSGRPNLAEAGSKLLGFAGEIASRKGLIEDDLRDRLSDFLLNIDFENLITAELFLEAEI